MILLIPSGTKKQVVIPTLFKFHYDSINSGASGEVWSSWWKFKFHYDSINSRLMQGSLLCLGNLNSIMILLILQSDRTERSDSSIFKFHYDSINSKWRWLLIMAGRRNLNSIMILLIPVPKSSPYLSQKTSLFCRPLQNSTFLSCP